MKHLHIVRSYLPEATVGYMDVSGQRLQTLEQPWRDNKPFDSCIPQGTYLAKRDRTGKHQFYAIQSVPKRSFIEWHVANYVSQLEGCTSFGLSRSKDNVSLNNSSDALNFILNEIGNEDFLVTYRAFNASTDQL